jgi:ATP10 protein
MRLWGRQVVAVVLLSWGVAAAQSQSARVPVTHGTTFAGTQVTLPDDLRGRVGVLVLGFSKSSGDGCKGWGQRLAASYPESSGVMYYQMPVLESVPKLIRGMVVKSIKSGVPEAEQAHFMPMFSGEAEWRKIARYANADDAYVLVVDGDGRVRWQTSGKATDAGFAALKEQVGVLRAQAMGSATK